MSEGKKINDAATVSGLPEGGFVLVADSGGGLKRLSVDALLADVRGAVKVGGRNLLRNSAPNIVDSTSYLLKGFRFGEDVVKKGDIVTVTIWGTQLEGVFKIFQNGDTQNIGNAEKISDGIYRWSGTWWREGASSINIFKNKNNKTDKATLSRIKLERGNVATDWTPAPEDYMPTNSTSGGVKERPLYALVVTPKGGVRHERGKGAYTGFGDRTFNSKKGGGLCLKVSI